MIGRGSSLGQNSPGNWKSSMPLGSSYTDKSGYLSRRGTAQAGPLHDRSQRFLVFKKHKIEVLSTLPDTQFCRHPSFGLSLTFDDLSAQKASRAPKNISNFYCNGNDHGVLLKLSKSLKVKESLHLTCCFTFHCEKVSCNKNLKLES